MVNFTRRKAIKGIGTGAIAALVPGTAEAEGKDRIFVQPEQTQSQAVDALEEHGGTPLFVYDNFDHIAGHVPSANRKDLESDDRVAIVENDGRVRAIHHRDGHDGGPPGDGGGDDGGCSDHPSQSQSWGHDRVDAGEVAEDGAGVDVAILDTGVDTEHCDLSVAGGVNCTGKGKGFDDKNGHGTHTAGIATADDNSIGVVGVAPGASLYGVKVLDNSGSGAWSNVVCGVDYCMNNDREVLSMSFGASSMPDSAHQAMSDAYAAGHLLVAAAGNEGNDENGSCEEDNVGQPARHPDVIAVSAMDPDNSLAGYSSVGTEVELMGPGTDIRSTYKGDDYATLSGTSMACPHVSGAGAVVWADIGATLEQEDEDASTDEGNDTVRETLKDSAEDVLNGSCEQGSGLLDVPAAVN